MFNLNMMFLKSFFIFIFICGNVMAGAKYEKEKVVPPYVGDSMSITILPPEISKSLKITRIPTPEPIPLTFGEGWDCQEYPGSSGIVHCTPYIVFCTEDQSLCACTRPCPVSAREPVQRAQEK